MASSCCFLERGLLAMNLASAASSAALADSCDTELMMAWYNLTVK